MPTRYSSREPAPPAHAAHRSAVRNTSQRATPLTRSPLQGSSSRRYCAGSLCIDRKARTERRRPTRRGIVPRRSPRTPLPARSVCLGHGRRRWICRLRTVASAGRKPEMPASACRRLPSDGARRQRPRAGPVLPCAPRDQEPAGSTGCSCPTACGTAIGRMSSEMTLVSSTTGPAPPGELLLTRTNTRREVPRCGRVDRGRPR